MPEESETVKACPDCGTASISPNVRCGIHGTPAKHDYRCKKCGWQGDEPDERERRGSHDAGLHGLAARLDKANPEDVSRSASGERGGA